jgi:two-component sensor histidine kinase
MDSSPQGLVPPISTLALALVISSRVPILLLDSEIRIVAASTTFYRDFRLTRRCGLREKFADLGSGEWNAPQLTKLLRAIADGEPQIDAYEMDLIRPDEPDCRLVLGAHRLDYQETDDEVLIVLTVTDVTAARLADQQKDELLGEKQLLMKELQHRVANSLQIIASVLLQSARKVNSEEVRRHLSDAHHRVMSVATLQRQLAITQVGEVVLCNYFGELCDSISASMIPEDSRLSLHADVDASTVDARTSVSLGLIVTELVINSLKHAFPGGGRSGRIAVTHRSQGSGWVLTVEDDGIGFPRDSTKIKPGLGTGIVEALAGQLDAQVEIADACPGTRVTITHG